MKKSINIIHHINGSKEKNHMIIEKMPKRHVIKYKSFKIKKKKLEIEFYFFNMRKDNYIKAPASNLLNWGKWYKIKLPTLTPIFNLDLKF